MITREIDLEDDEHFTMGSLALLYSGGYEDKGSLPIQEPGVGCGISTFVSSNGFDTFRKLDDPVLTNIKAYIAAEKFDISHLKKLAATKYK